MTKNFGNDCHNEIRPQAAVKRLWSDQYGNVRVRFVRTGTIYGMKSVMSGPGRFMMEEFLRRASRL